MDSYPEAYLKCFCLRLTNFDEVCHDGDVDSRSAQMELLAKVVNGSKLHLRCLTGF